jgi:hypothetical protein
VPGLIIDQLIAIEDITAAVDSVPEDQRDAAVSAATTRIAARHGGDSAGIVVEPVALWNGARTSAYVFRRFTDIRVVMAPELQLGFFGGDPDNFTYPRYALDMSFLRVYRDGRPYQPEAHFKWSAAGVRDGEPVFVIGNPGSTSRLQTVAQLEYRRDVGDRALVDFFTSHIGAMEAYRAAFPVQAESVDIRNKIFGLSNSLKAYTGIWSGLNDPVIMARRQDAEARFQAAIARDPSLPRDSGRCSCAWPRCSGGSGRTMPRCARSRRWGARTGRPRS